MMHDPEIIRVQPGAALRGETHVPGDKSISHRSILLGMLAEGTTEVRGWLAAGDTEATLGAARTLGVPIERHDTNTLTIHGGNLIPPSVPLNFVNAGTGIRLAAGIMAGQSFPSVLDGSEQLRRRPMKRITDPLARMGAQIEAANDRAPLRIVPAALHGIRYEMPVASAQVKSALLLAALFAEGATEVVEAGPSRDHTERMLSAMGVQIETMDGVVRLTPGAALQPLDLTVPGDFSSAAFLMVAGAIVPDSEMVIRGVNINQTRTGLFDALQAMGARITIENEALEAGEPIGDAHVRHSVLRGIEVGGELVVRMIDEFPAFMLAALMAEGETVVRDARELRVKETDRIAVMATELRQLGAVIEEREDGFRVVGPQRLHGAHVEGHDDHRVAMSLAIAGMVAEGETIVHDARCARDSFPGFTATVGGLGGRIEAYDEA